MAIGTGNIWRFPRIIATNGGGTFLIPWLIFLATWSIPLLIVESAMGKAARRGTVGSFTKLVGARSTWKGAFVGFCAMAIGFYYSVVTGWCLKYLWMACTGQLLGQDPTQVWTTLSESPGQKVLFHFLSVSIATFVIFRGVSGGIEKVNRVLIPALFLIMMIAAGRAVTLPGSLDGMEFLFHVEWARLGDYRIWLEGLTQSAWSTGAGAGLILTFSVYARRRQNVVFSSVMTGLGNNSASLLAAIAVIPTVFALMPSAEAIETISTPGPNSTGMTFVAMPALLQEIAGGSTFFLPLFFLAISFAAISSMIAVLELGARNFADFGVPRRRAVAIVYLCTFLFGIPSALFPSFFSNQDWTWGLGLSVSGFFIAMAARSVGQRKLIEEWINTAPGWKVGARFAFLVTWLIPVQLFVLFGWCVFQSVTASDGDWWNPLRTASLGTAVCQWTVAIVLFLSLNSFLARNQKEIP